MQSNAHEVNYMLLANVLLSTYLHKYGCTLNVGIIIKMILWHLKYLEKYIITYVRIYGMCKKEHLGKPSSLINQGLTH